MSRIYAQQKRPGAKAAEPSYGASAAHTPSLVSGQSSSDLDALMQAKYRQHFLDNQIPHAEAEADRIAASVSGARTPEEVKTQLGEKMGANFSNVTFHTDPAALKQADAMGARAYTTGSDVYFGSGGFDPGVAAHELVHTVQQGMVGSTMGTTSAPTGGVQMMPKWFNYMRASRQAKKYNKERLKERQANLRDEASAYSDLDARESFLRDYYDAGLYGYSDIEVPNYPDKPDERARYGNAKERAEYAAAREKYESDLANYNENHDSLSAAFNADFRKNQNDVFGFRNHWWQFWRAKKGDFRSLAKKIK